MVRYIKIKEIPDRCTHIRVENTFDKNLGGYAATMTPVVKFPNSYQVVYDGEYFEKYRPLSVLLVGAKRRSANKEEAAEHLLDVNAKNYAMEYAKIVKDRGGNMEILE